MYNKVYMPVFVVVAFFLIIILTMSQLYESKSQKYLDEITRLSEENYNLQEEISAKSDYIEEQDSMIGQLQQTIEELSVPKASEPPIEETVSVCSMPVDVDTDFKSYMDYRKVTNTSSTQYKLLQDAVSDPRGLMTIDGYYCIATGSAYGDLGDHLLVTLENGNQFYAIKSDEKSDVHTIDGKIDSLNSSVVEFIVDTNSLDHSVKTSGTVSVLDDFSSKVVDIAKI